MKSWEEELMPACIAAILILAFVCLFTFMVNSISPRVTAWDSVKIPFRKDEIIPKQIEWKGEKFTCVLDEEPDGASFEDSDYDPLGWIILVSGWFVVAVIGIVTLYRKVKARTLASKEAAVQLLEQQIKEHWDNRLQLGHTKVQEHGEQLL